MRQMMHEKSAGGRGVALWCVSLSTMLMVACTVSDTGQTPRDDSAGAPGIRSSEASGRAPAVADTGHAGTDAGAPIGAEGGSSGTRAVEYYTAAFLDHVADSLARGTTTGHMIGSRSTYQYLQIRRAASGVPEVHDRWIDVTTVQAGHGTLLSGGSVTGSVMQGGGEHRGGQIVGGSRRAVGPGDLMIIPAGIPHQYEIARGDSLRYLTVKVLAVPR